MKKLLIATTAIAGIATVSTPAMAQALELDLGGFYRGYGVFADTDGATDTRDFDLRHDSEIHFTGETTLNNGLKVGFHAETELAQANAQDEVYAYFSGQWGRVNLGQEDGAAYLLQVAAPSADSNVDGLRTYIQGFGLNNGTGVVHDYAQDMGEFAQKITYLTPKFNGFQAGVSYAPEVTDDGGGAIVGNGVLPMSTDNDGGHVEDLMEIAARWDGTFDNVGLSLGAGYGTADNETSGAPATDDVDQWNVGANLQWTAFEFGAAYTETNTEASGADADTEAWTVGLGWANGPYTAGATYYESDSDVLNEAERWTLGGTYNYGPGMTFRGALAFGEVEAPSGSDEDFTQVTLGTEINF